MVHASNILQDLDTTNYNWLITGVGGFIGSHLLEYLLKRNQQVIGLDNFSTGFKSNIEEVTKKFEPNYIEKNFRLIEGDIRDLSTCMEASKAADFVLHQAALGSVNRSIDDPISTNENNLNGFLNIMRASENNKVKRVVFASSSSVYGDNEKLPKTEPNIGNPLSPYAATKLMNEIYAHVFSENYGIEYIGLRYFNVFGERQDPKGDYAAVIPLWIDSVVNGNEVFINGDGETSRDFCFIDNVVQANILSALTDNKDALNQCFNVACGSRITLNKLLSFIIDITKKLIDLQEDPKISFRDFRKGDIRHSLASIDAAIKMLTYDPKINVREGLEKTISYFIQQNGENR